MYSQYNRLTGRNIFNEQLSEITSSISDNSNYFQTQINSLSDVDTLNSNSFQVQINFANSNISANSNEIVSLSNNLQTQISSNDTDILNINSTLNGYSNNFTTSNLFLNGTNSVLDFKTGDNSVDDQSLIVYRNSGSVQTLNLRRDISNSVENKPDFIFGCGSNVLLDTLGLLNTGNVQIYNNLLLGTSGLNVENKLNSLDGEIQNLEDQLSDNGNLNPYEIIKEVRDWIGAGMDALVMATLYSYFGANGIKNQFVDDLIEKFDDVDFTGEDQQETDDNTNRGQSIVKLEDIYEKTFAVPNTGSDTGFYGNVLMTDNSRISVNNNISYSNGDTIFANNASGNNDVMVFRDTITGLQKEGFVDYMFVGLSNQDQIGTLSPQNDYTYNLNVSGDFNLDGNLNINGNPFINYDNVNDTVGIDNLNSLSLKSSNTNFLVKTLDNSIDQQNVLLCQNSGDSYTFQLRRDLLDTTNSVPNYVFSIGSNIDKTLLTDSMKFFNNGNISIHNELSLGNNIEMQQNNILGIGSNQWDLDLSLTDLNSRIQVQQDLIDSNSISTVETAFGIWLDNSQPVPDNAFTFGTLQNECYKNLDLNSNNLIGIGVSNYNLETTLVDWTLRVQNLDSNGQIDYSNILNIPDSNQRSETLDMNINDIIEINCLQFQNKEIGNVLSTDGTVFYDRNFYAETGSNFVNITGTDIGGLSIYDGTSWAGLVSDKNMVGLDATMNSLVLNTGLTVQSNSTINFNNNIIQNVSQIQGGFELTGDLDLGGNDILDCLNVKATRIIMRATNFGITDSNVFTKFLLDEDGSTQFFNTVNLIESGGTIYSSNNLILQSDQLYHKNILGTNLLSLNSNSGQITASTDFTIQSDSIIFKDSAGNTNMQLIDATGLTINKPIFFNSTAYIQSDFDIELKSDNISFEARTGDQIQQITPTLISMTQPLQVNNTLNTTGIITASNGIITDLIKAPLNDIELQTSTGTQIASFSNTVIQMNQDTIFTQDLYANDIVANSSVLTVHNSDKSQSIDIKPSLQRIDQLQVIRIQDNDSNFIVEKSGGNDLFRIDGNLGSYQQYITYQQIADQSYGSGNNNITSNIANFGQLNSNAFNSAWTFCSLSNNGIKLPTQGSYEIFGTVAMTNDELSQTQTFDCSIYKTLAFVSSEKLFRFNIPASGTTEYIGAFHTIIHTTNNNEIIWVRVNTSCSSWTVGDFTVHIKKL